MKKVDMPRTSIVRIGPRQHPTDISVGCVGNEALRAFQYVGIPSGTPWFGWRRLQGPRQAPSRRTKL